MGLSNLAIPFILLGLKLEGNSRVVLSRAFTKQHSAASAGKAVPYNARYEPKDEFMKDSY